MAGAQGEGRKGLVEEPSQKGCFPGWPGCSFFPSALQEAFSVTCQFARDALRAMGTRRSRSISWSPSRAGVAVWSGDEAQS